MRKTTYIISTLLLLSACRNDNQFQQPVAHSKVMPRPILALMPVIDHARHRLGWDVSHALSMNIHHALLSKDHFYMIDQERVQKKFKELQPNQDPFGEDLSWIKKKFRTEEFVAFIELEKDQETLLNFQRELPDSECSAELFLSARLKIFDLRSTFPKVVLSETITHSENIPKQFTRANLTNPILPGQEGFETTPHGIAHNQFAKEIAERIEDYIFLAQEH